MRRHAHSVIPSNIIAACIVAVSLVAAALIDSHRLSQASASGRPVPPIAQESAREQFRSQVLAAPALHIYNTGNSAYYTLKDVNVKSVEYDAKDDAFTVVYGVIGQSETSAQDIASGTATLHNDGYGHYHGTVVFDKIEEDHDSTDVVLQRSE